MISSAEELRWSRGFSAMVRLPVLVVAFTVPVPTKLATPATSGSRRTMSATSRWRSAIALTEMEGAASVTPMMTPVSCCGRKPLGTTS